MDAMQLWALITAIVAVVMAAAIAYYGYFRITGLQKKIRVLEKALAGIGEDCSKLKENSAILDETVEDLQVRITKVHAEAIRMAGESSKAITAASARTASAQLQSKPASTHNRKAAFGETRYGNLQYPDSNGRVKFSIETLSAQASGQKMFKLNFDNETGKGEYCINPEAMQSIKNDLQLFKYFVKPFSFTGNADNVTVSDVKPGKISRSGKFWIVDELLEVKVK